VKYSLPGEYRKECIAIEAQAAALYWQMVAELIDDESDFKGRERKGAKDLVNSMLNYGYAILYARITQAIMKARLNPAISFLHVPQTHKPSLAFDIIELFRQQAVDRVVISLIQKKEKMEIVKGLLSNESKSKLTQNIYERLHRYETYRGEKRRFSDIISIQTSALAQYISGEADTYKPYIAKW
jgi:CRISPR-associated endonuclease Cas1